MAEAVVDERPPLPTRFYCHMCSMEVNIPNTDFTCPHCSGGFVEELPAVPSTTSASSSTSSLADGPSNAGSDALGLNRLVDLDVIRGEIETLLMSRNGPIEIAIGPANRRNSMLLGGGAGGTNAGSNSSGNGSSGGGRVHPPNLGSLDTVLLDFLQSLSGGDDGYFGNAPMFFMGNPGDYAWGREGIDTIVTQLLNQMETSGPPPLPKDKIDEIPKVHVTSEDVERKTQCSVCWEDFRMDEIVRRLPCTHIYHENCIVPWLDLHGTCPICRKSLSEEDEANECDMTRSGVMDSSMTEISQSDDTTMERAGPYENTQSTSNSATQSVPAGSGSSQTENQQQQQQNNVFGFDDSAVDLD
ncbi:PREDICTED: E3 ubiquitin-protein ligase RNF126-B [Rhagoletis zephyria]|uniref:E3 ubiquitin-protein ligase RNF126-B n=1 Tax=Rhagoletis zephyria TaxID=28612 RepID=UPI0008117DEB|nr:PREDICTED: E3 ubiquitin-protein ligase RNF126-B [Rhagoletis zephyria]